MTTTLTASSVSRLFAGHTDGGPPIVQVMDFRTFGTQNHQGPSRYRVRISDGTHFMSVMIATQLNHLLEGPNASIHQYSIVRITNVITNVVQNRRIGIILGCDVHDHMAHVIGEPRCIIDGFAWGEQRHVDPLVESLRKKLAAAQRQLAAVAAMHEVVVLSAAPNADAPNDDAPNDDAPNADASSSSPLARLPHELMLLLASQVTPDAMLPFALTCRALRDATYVAVARADVAREQPAQQPQPRHAAPTTPAPLMRTSVRSVVLGGRDYLAWAHRHAGCPLPALRVAAAKLGLVHVLEWVGEHDTPHHREWDQACAVEAARAGHVHVLEWAKARGHPILVDGFEAATREAAREHSRQLYTLLQMPRSREMMIADGDGYSPVGLRMMEVSSLPLEELVHTYFMGTELLDDDDEDRHSMAGMLRTVCTPGATEAAKRAAVAHLLATGRLVEVVVDGGNLPPDERLRYRPVTPFDGGPTQPSLAAVVTCFFYFGENAPERNEGYTFDELLGWAIGLGASEDELRTTLEGCVEEGYLYSTVDDDHYKAT